MVDFDNDISDSVFGGPHEIQSQRRRTEVGICRQDKPGCRRTGNSGNFDSAETHSGKASHGDFEGVELFFMRTPYTRKLQGRVGSMAGIWFCVILNGISQSVLVETQMIRTPEPAPSQQASGVSI